MTFTNSVTKGVCQNCKKVVLKSASKQHVLECFDSKGNQKFFHISVQSPERSHYWMHLAVAEDSSLDKLDAILRKVWMECCGHLSRFAIGSESYSSEPNDACEDKHEHEMRKTLASDVLSQGTKFQYEYDFGSTTHLSLRVLERVTLDLPLRKRNSAAVLIRNEKPEAKCDQCEKEARFIVSEGMSDNDDLMFCLACGKKVDENETPILPLVNSPRSGQCGYRGKPY